MISSPQQSMLNPKKVEVSFKPQSSIFKKLRRFICPCVSSSPDTILTQRSSFLSDEKEQMDQITYQARLSQIPTPVPKTIYPKVPLFRSAFEKRQSPTKVQDIVPNRSYSDDEIQMQIMVIGNSKYKMLTKISSIRLSASKQAIQKTKSLMCKKQNPLLLNPETDEFVKCRYYIFQNFDKGVKMEKTSWSNTLPEAVAEYIAIKAKCTKILDGLAGIGATSIKFANTCHIVLANDPDENKMYCLQNNTALFGADNIAKTQKNFLDLNDINVDVVFLNPIIKNPKDRQIQILHPQSYFSKPSLYQLLVKSLSFSNNVIMILPGNINIQQLGVIYNNALIKARPQTSTSCSIKIQKIYFNRKLKYISVYYGPLVNRDITIKDELNFIYRLLNDNQSTQFKYKNVVKHIRSKYGMTQLLLFTSECLKYQKQTMISRFLEMIRINDLLPEKLMINLLRQPSIILNKLPTLQQQKFDQFDNYQQPESKSSRTNSFATEQAEQQMQARLRQIRQTIYINGKQNKNRHTVEIESNSSYSNANSQMQGTIQQ